MGGRRMESKETEPLADTKQRLTGFVPTAKNGAGVSIQSPISEPPTVRKAVISTAFVDSTRRATPFVCTVTGAMAGSGAGSST